MGDTGIEPVLSFGQPNEQDRRRDRAERAAVEACILIRQLRDAEPSREAALAFTKAEETVMWLYRATRRD